MSLNEPDLSQNAFEFAVNSIEKIKPTNQYIISIIDFTKPSTEKRFFVIDLATKKILPKTYVAHQMGSGENYATKFSNIPNSKMSSPGLYLTGETYNGKHEYSLKLIGLKKGINDKAIESAVVIHGAWYVSEEFFKQNERLGRRRGCPAVVESIVKKLIDIIKNSTIIFIYTNDQEYWKTQNSSLINEKNIKYPI